MATRDTGAPCGYITSKLVQIAEQQLAGRFKEGERLVGMTGRF